MSGNFIEDVNLMSDVSTTEILNNLRAGFLEELPSRIALIENEILSSLNGDAYDEIFRMVHSLKGSAGSYGFHIISKIAHHLEDVMLHLVQQNKFNAEFGTDILLEYVDLFNLAISSLKAADESSGNVDFLLDGLHDKTFGHSHHVLISESSASYSTLIERSLVGLPIQCTYVNDGFIALEHLLTNKYSLFITAMETPPLNADALIAALRCSHARNKNIDSLLITSHDKSKIQNYEMFSSVQNKNIVQSGKLKKIVAGFIS